MSCFQKQLVIHKFSLPVEILHIIKDFCFKPHTVQTEKTRRLKSHFIKYIKYSCNSEYSVDASTGTTTITASQYLYGVTNAAFKKRHPFMNEQKTILKRTMCNICGNFRPQVEAYRHPRDIIYHRVDLRGYPSDIMCHVVDEYGYSDDIMCSRITCECPRPKIDIDF